MRLHFVGVEDLGEIFDFNQVVVGCHSIPLFSVVSDQMRLGQVLGLNFFRRFHKRWVLYITNWL